MLIGMSIWKDVKLMLINPLHNKTVDVLPYIVSIFLLLLSSNKSYFRWFEIFWKIRPNDQEKNYNSSTSQNPTLSSFLFLSFSIFLLQI